MAPSLEAVAMAMVNTHGVLMSVFSGWVNAKNKRKEPKKRRKERD